MRRARVRAGRRLSSGPRNWATWFRTVPFLPMSNNPLGTKAAEADPLPPNDFLCCNYRSRSANDTVLPGAPRRISSSVSSRAMGGRRAVPHSGQTPVGMPVTVTPVVRVSST